MTLLRNWLLWFIRTDVIFIWRNASTQWKCGHNQIWLYISRRTGNGNATFSNHEHRQLWFGWEKTRTAFSHKFDYEFGRRTRIRIALLMTVSLSNYFRIYQQLKQFYRVIDARFLIQIFSTEVCHFSDDWRLPWRANQWSWQVLWHAYICCDSLFWVMSFLAMETVSCVLWLCVLANYVCHFTEAFFGVNRREFTLKKLRPCNSANQIFLTFG